MRRRDFIGLLGGAAAAWPLAGLAQQPERMRRIGILIGGSASDPAPQRNLAAFREGLAKLGWIEGRNLRIDLRFAAADFEHARVIAAELVSFAPEVIFVTTGTATRAMQQQTQTIPTVFVGPGSAVADEDISRPKGNMTGFPVLYPSIAGKWVELLKEADPRVARVMVVASPDLSTQGATTSNYIPPIEAAARALALKVIAEPYLNDANLEGAIAAFTAEPNGGLIVLPGTRTTTRASRDLVRQLAVKYRVPVIHWDSPYPAEGGLMSYGSNFEDLHRRAASYVDRILRGAKVSELPVERPTKFELIVNTKAAKAIGLTISELFLARADEVIE
jgi:putative ABC transport system substrate-binding protein